MVLPNAMVKAVYKESRMELYRGNPFIEALPPTMEIPQVARALKGTPCFNANDINASGQDRAHLITSLLDTFFQPLNLHLQLYEKISLMIRQGYLGRNPCNGSLNSHMQNGYARVMQGNLSACRFHHTQSTALSLSLIGCSGSGKTTTLNRILSTYPQVIFHESLNHTQVTYLKVDCPHDGSLKSLCINFFRSLDLALNTNYEMHYARRRLGIETLLASMSQIATAHAVGVLVIDEIQHLSKSRSGGIEKMLNFFVTLVNTIGLPVIFVGTPKARPIFEMDLRSARRGAGFGSLFWEPMKNIPFSQNEDVRTDWIAFTNALWKYQWLQKSDTTLKQEVRDCWYDLSQGVLDIVVKLFVLAQLRAVNTKVERITTGLLQKVYEDELKPVHPMLAALRSNDPERIAEYSDLVVPDIDIRLLQLRGKIETFHEASTNKQISFNGDKRAQRLYELLCDIGCSSPLLYEWTESVVKQHPDLSMPKLVAIVLDWNKEGQNKEQKQSPLKKNKSLPEKQWHTLDSCDLRFKFSQKTSPTLYENLKQDSIIFDMDLWLENIA